MCLAFSHYGTKFTEFCVYVERHFWFTSLFSGCLYCVAFRKYSSLYVVVQPSELRHFCTPCFRGETHELSTYIFKSMCQSLVDSRSVTFVWTRLNIIIRKNVKIAEGRQTLATESWLFAGPHSSNFGSINSREPILGACRRPFGVFEAERGSVSPKISGRRGRPPPTILRVGKLDELSFHMV